MKWMLLVLIYGSGCAASTHASTTPGALGPRLIRRIPSTLIARSSTGGATAWRRPVHASHTPKVPPHRTEAEFWTISAASVRANPDAGPWPVRFKGHIWPPRPILTSLGQSEREALVQVVVRDNNVDQALRALKKKMQREGIFREMKLRNYYEKPSEKRAREKAEAIRRARKLARKKAQREGGGGTGPSPKPRGPRR